MRLTKFISALSATLIPLSAFATDWYISPSGSDSAD